MKTLQGQVILITGAAGGFGQALTKRLLPLGPRLALADIDRQQLAERTAKMLEAAKLTERRDQILGYFAADLASPVGAQALFDAVSAAVPEIDMLVNNAGIAMSGHFVDMPQDAWETLMQVNLLAPMRLTVLVLPGMIQRRRGHIVNISSLAGLVGTPYLVPYSTAKFGLRGFTEALAGDLKPFGIDVTAIYPFYARTAILDSPHYGAMPRSTVPDRLLSEPDFVMARLIDGIRRRKVHVYPGSIPHIADFLRRVAPWTLPWIFPDS